MESETIVLFTFHQRLGVSYTILAASCSLAATLPVLGYAGFRTAKRWIDARRGRARLVGRSDVVESALFINLMVFDVVEAVAVFPNVKWMNDARVTEGSLCTAQAVLKNIGGVGIASASLAIGLHTFAIIVLDWKPRRRATAMIIAAVWAFIALIVIIPNIMVRHGLHGPVGFWCFYSVNHKQIQILHHYLWLWLDGLLMILLYSIMFAVVRGWLIVDNGKLHWYRNHRPTEHDSWEEEESDEDREIKAVAKKLLFYPAVYIASILPNSLARWLYYSHHPSSYQFTLFANCLHILSGAFDVALFLRTRPDIIGRGPIDNARENETCNMQMTCTTHGSLPTRHIDNCESSTSSPLEESVLSETSKHWQGSGSHSSRHLDGRSVSGGGYVPPAARGRPRQGGLLSTGVREDEDLGSLPV